MELLPSAHVDTFCRDHLPPAEQWPELTFDLPELQYPDRLNCATALLDDVAARHGGDRPCLHQPGQPTWSYDELMAAANRIAHVLVEDLGIVPGNRVLLRGPNNQWLSAAWFGVLKAGAVLVTTMPLLRTGELRDHPRDRPPRRGAGRPPVPRRGRAARRPDPRLRRRRLGRARSAAKPATFDDVRDLQRRRVHARLHLRHHRPARRRRCTSTATCSPICDTFSRHVLQPSADDVFTGTPPYAFTFGLGGVLLFPLHAGASTLLVEKATPVELADLIDEHGVTICFTAPTAYKAMLAAGQDRADAAQGGVRRRAPAEGDLGGVPRRDRRRDHRRHRRDRDAAHLHLRRRARTSGPGSTGRAVPGYAATIVDDAGHELPGRRVRAAGRQGPDRLPLPRRRRARRRYVRNGWNLTGDTFIRDDDGYFWYQARSDDMIISSGYNIAAPEVEEALLKHPLVAECAVIGVPDEARGMLVKAYVVQRRARSTRRRAAGLREGRDRAVQVPARDRVRRRAAEDRDRQAPAVPAASAARLAGSSEPPLMPDHSPRHLILSLFGLYARATGRDGGELALGALADRADGGPRRRRRRHPLVGLAAEEARRARAGQGRRAGGLPRCRRRRSPCSARATPASGRGRGPRSPTAGWSSSSRSPRPSAASGTSCGRC